MKKFFVKLKKVFVGRDRDSSKIYITPYRDWGILFVIFTALFVVVVAVHTFLFFGVQNGTLFRANIGGEAAQKTLNTELLDKTINFFDGKKAKFDQALGG